MTPPERPRRSLLVAAIMLRLAAGQPLPVVVPLSCARHGRAVRP